MKVHVTQEQMSEIQKKLFNIGLINAAKLVGGYKGLSKIFNGNLEPFYDNFAEKYGITPVYLSIDKMSLYIHDSMVQNMGLEDLRFSKRKEKVLGKFKFGSKNSFQYLLNANLIKTNLRDMEYWKVIGTSGSYGFGVGFLTKKETLGIRYRTQIYNQILDKYDLRKYSNT